MTGLYCDEVDVEVNSAICGCITEIQSLAELKECPIPVLREWAKDEELQYLRVASANIGFVRTYQKRYMSP